MHTSLCRGIDRLRFPARPDLLPRRGGAGRIWAFLKLGVVAVLLAAGARAQNASVSSAASYHAEERRPEALDGLAAPDGSGDSQAPGFSEAADAGHTARAGAPDADHPAAAPVTVSGLPLGVLQDQRAIWTSPAHIRWQDTRWLAPLATATGLLIESDHHTMSELIRTNATAQDRSSTISDATLGGLAGVPALMYGWSLYHYSPRARETGILAAEALADAMVVSEASKAVSRRDPPSVSAAQGKFFDSSFQNSSFPSNHAMAAWSMAAVMGDEYPGAWARIGIYSLATAVSVSRMTANQHFPSDVLVGSSFGWLIGHYVYRARHVRTEDSSDSSLAEEKLANRSVYVGAGLNPAAALQQNSAVAATLTDRPYREQFLDPDQRGTVYVPMDSWVYPALDRLYALGFIEWQNAAIRPWTREECLRQIQNAEATVEHAESFDRLSGGRRAALNEAERLITQLHTEFAHEHDSEEAAVLESLYARAGTIAGHDLNDSYHLGQTWDNDYGRPFQEGTSGIGGFAARAISGRFSLYVREEYQHAPAAPAFSLPVREFIASLDVAPLLPPTPIATANRARPIEMYGGVSFGGWMASFGKQEMYWGPTVEGPLSWSINAEPTYNLQLATSRPHQLPGFLSIFGTYTVDVAVGKLSGHNYPARPWFNGQKISLDVTPNFEMSFTRWSLFAGVGHPLTLDNFIRNFFSFTSPTTGQDPGDRKSGFDFRYKLPGARWIMLYADSYADDEPNPVDSPRRSAIAPGIYFSRLPGISRMDLRVEAPGTQLLAIDQGPNFLYTNDVYRDANTNKGFLLGNSVGRDGRRITATSTYWFSSRTKLTGEYRQTKFSSENLPGGGTQTDASLRGSIALGKDWNANLFSQYERFWEPLQGGPQRNLTGQIQLEWHPNLRLNR